MPRGGMAARGPPVGVLRSAAHRRAESRFWGVFIIAVHRAFVLGLGAQHRGIVELSEDRDVCDSVRLLYLLTYLLRTVRVLQLNNFRGHLFRPGHRCFGLRDRGGQGSFSAAQRRAASEANWGAKGEYSLKKRS